MNRKKFLQQTSLASAGFLMSNYSFAEWKEDFPVVRVPESQRKFKSPAVKNLLQK